MNKKKSIVPVIIIAVLLVFIAVVATMLLISPKIKLNKQLDLGNKYLQEEDYDQAIKAFKAAIRIDPKSEDAYIGLAKAYIKTEDYSKAKKILEEGIEELESADNDAGVKRLEEWLDKVLEKLEKQQKEEKGQTTETTDVTEADDEKQDDEKSDDAVTVGPSQMGYTDEELETMALDYYEKFNGYRPQYAAVDHETDGMVLIQLYDIVNVGEDSGHTATSDWYTVDRYTGKGTNFFEEPIDLSIVAK